MKNKLYKITTCLYSFRIFLVKAPTEKQARRQLYNYLTKKIYYDHQYVFDNKQTECNEVVFEDKAVQIS